MPSQSFNASGVLMALVRVAEVISPSHARAVAEYVLPYADMDTDTNEFARIVNIVAMNLLAEIDTACRSGEMVNTHMAMVPYDTTDASVVAYRAESEKVFNDIRMVDGRFVFDDNGEFWP
jgi:hypothetical protein